MLLNFLNCKLQYLHDEFIPLRQNKKSTVQAEIKWRQPELITDKTTICNSNTGRIESLAEKVNTKIVIPGNNSNKEGLDNLLIKL